MLRLILDRLNLTSSVARVSAIEVGLPVDLEQSRSLEQRILASWTAPNSPACFPAPVTLSEVDAFWIVSTFGRHAKAHDSWLLQHTSRLECWYEITTRFCNSRRIKWIVNHPKLPWDYSAFLGSDLLLYDLDTAWPLWTLKLGQLCHGTSLWEHVARWNLSGMPLKPILLRLLLEKAASTLASNSTLPKTWIQYIYDNALPFNWTVCSLAQSSSIKASLPQIEWVSQENAFKITATISLQEILSGEYYWSAARLTNRDLTRALAWLQDNPQSVYAKKVMEACARNPELTPELVGIYSGIEWNLIVLCYNPYQRHSAYIGLYAREVYWGRRVVRQWRFYIARRLYRRYYDCVMDQLELIRYDLARGTFKGRQRLLT